MSKERRLGRGLEALLGRPLNEDLYANAAPPVNLHVAEPAVAGNSLASLSVYEVDSSPFQPRREFDEAEIATLADSLNEHGLLQPIVVRRQGERYQLIAGERRLRAAIRAGWSEVPAQVRDVDDRQAAELAIVENLQRRDLNALEKAASFQQYLERYGCTQEELAGRLQIDRSTVANLIRLLELPQAVQQAVRAGTISPGHARALLPLGDEREQVAYCKRIQSESLSVRAIEQLVQDTIRSGDEEQAPSPGGAASPGRTRKARRSGGSVAALEQQLRAALGTKVDVREAAKGRGRIVIHFTSREEFDRLQSYLCGDDEPMARSKAG